MSNYIPLEDAVDPSQLHVDTPRTRRSKLSLLISSLGFVFAFIACVATLSRLRMDHDEGFGGAHAFRNDHVGTLKTRKDLHLPRTMLIAEEDILEELAHMLEIEDEGVGEGEGQGVGDAGADARAAILIKLKSREIARHTHE